MPDRRAHSLVELLVVIAIVGILAALLLPALSRAKLKASRGACIQNQRQIGTALLLYAEAQERFPTTNQIAINFPSFIRRYIGSNSSVYQCPADKFVLNHPGERWDKSSFDIFGTSYLFNGRSAEEFRGGPAQTLQDATNGLDGIPLTSIVRPDLTVLTYELPGSLGYSWHAPRSKTDYYNDAMNVFGFVDGHVEYLRTYWTNTGYSHCDPPPGYSYKWSPY